MPITVSRTVETRSVRRTSWRRANLSLAWGSSNSTMNSMMVGMIVGTGVHRPLNRRNVCDHCRASARIDRAEVGQRQAAEATDDGGRERRDDEERERPARRHARVGCEQDPGQRGQRASERPREARDQRRSALRRAARPRLSTTARIETPRRVRNNRMRKPMASATATTIVIRRCPGERSRRAMSTPPSPNSCGSV